MLAGIPVARKDAILLMFAGILMIILAMYNEHSALALAIAAVAITRGAYKWITSPTIKTQVAVPIFK